MALFDTLKTILTPYSEKINKHTTDISILSEDAEKINKHTTDISILSEDVENVRADLNEAVDSLNGSLDALINVLPTDTASGAIASFTDGADDIPVKNLTVDIEPVQSGTGDPSPDNVRPISGWTGASIKRTGKNLFGGSILKAKLLEIGGSDHGDNIGIGSSILNGKILFDTIFKERTRYTLILDVKKPSGNTNSNVRIYYTDGSFSNIFLSGEITERQTVVVNSTSGKTISKIMGINASAGTYFYFNTCGLFEGVLTAEDFESYEGEYYTVDWTNEAGEVYGGILDITNGVIRPYKYYSSYNGETLSGEWISSLDAYSADTSPTIGAQVVNFGRFDEDISLTPQEVKTILGDNNIFANTGDVSVEYRADIKKYIDNRINNIGITMSDGYLSIEDGE